MFENIAAIDIGATSIKMIKVRNGIRNFQIRSLSYEDIDAGNPDYRSAAGAALKKMLAEDPVSGFTIVSNLPMENSIIRNIAFPFSDVKKIAEAIPFEAEENVPFRLDELVMDFQTLHSGRTDEGRVLLAASRRETVNDHVRLLQEADMIPAHLGLEANSLFSCYSHFNRVAGENVIQIDIGYSKSIINIIIDGRLQYTRSCPASLKAIITSIGSLHGIPAGQALGVFHELNIDMTALDNNLQRDYYRKLDIKKNQMKSIYSIASGVLDDLAEQITLTMGACGLIIPMSSSAVSSSPAGAPVSPGWPHAFPGKWASQWFPHPFPMNTGSRG